MFLRIFTAAGSLLFIPPVNLESQAFTPSESTNVGLSCETAPSISNVLYEVVTKTRNDPLFQHLQKQRQAGVSSEAEAQQLLLLELTIHDAEKVILVADYVVETCQRKARI